MILAVREELSQLACDYAACVDRLDAEALLDLFAERRIDCQWTDMRPAKWFDPVDLAFRDCS